MKGKRRGPTKGRNLKDKGRLTDTGALSKADRVDERDRRDCYKSEQNDPAWYAQNAQLLSDYASFPFGVPIGIQLPSTLTTTVTKSVPGLMAYYYAPMIGSATQETDPVNIAARNIYSYVRHANSGHSNYDSPDLMMYLLAMDSVYMFHAYMKRALGVVLDYTPVNRYYPQALLVAMGLDPDDVQAHVADFRGFINTYAVKMGSMCVPNSMSYMARHTWMTEGIYTDSPSNKAQSYMYVPYQYFKLQIYDNEGTAVTGLQRVNFFDAVTYQGTASELKKVSDLISFGNQLLNPILTNEDMNIMSGDILKAFGPDGIVKVSGVMDGYMVLPMYNQEVMSQFENLRVFGAAAAAAVNDQHITQDTSIGGGYIKDTTTWRLSMGLYGTATNKASSYARYFPGLTSDKILNFHHDAVTPAEVMVATRLMVNATVLNTTGSSGGVSGYNVQDVVCGGR